MDFRLTDEQRMLRRTIRDLVEKEITTLQLHGGYGFSREFPVERLLREARGMVLGGNPPQLQRNMIADELIKRGFPSWT